MKQMIIVSLCALMMACTNGQKDASKQPQADKAFAFEAETGTECEVKFGDVTFTRALNGADTLVTIESDGRLRFNAGEKADFFCDPDEKISNNTAPVLLTEIDNTKPFALTAKVSPEFTKTGLYNAGVLYVYANPTFWQKFCFEQDERGKHRIVSVRTMGTSDDNNHDILDQDWAYMRIFSDTRTLALYYSLDGQEWQMVRLYKNNYPERVFLGISNQCPQDKGSHSYFENMTLTTEQVGNIRMGS